MSVNELSDVVVDGHERHAERKQARDLVVERALRDGAGTSRAESP